MQSVNLIEMHNVRRREAHRLQTSTGQCKWGKSNSPLKVEIMDIMMFNAERVDLNKDFAFFSDEFNCTCKKLIFR